MDLLILLSFLELLDFFERHQWTIPGHEEDQGDHEDQQSQVGQEHHTSFVSRSSANKANIAGSVETPARSAISRRLGSQCSLSHRRGTRSESVVLSVTDALLKLQFRECCG
jgi:hypothetical protein